MRNIWGVMPNMRFALSAVAALWLAAAPAAGQDPEQPGVEPGAVPEPGPVPEPQPQPNAASPVPLTSEPPPPAGTTGPEAAPQAPSPESIEGATEAPPEPEPEPEKEEFPQGKAGWVPGKGFTIASEDENYRLRVGLQSGYKAEVIRRDGEFQDRSPFFTVRPLITGSIFKPWIQFWTSLEVARNPPYLLDCYVDVQPWDEFGLRIGQQYTPFSRHEYYGPQQILFPEFAPVAEYFWSGRDKGLTALGVLGGGAIEYWAGFYGGSPLRQFTTIAGNYVFEGRITINPLGKPIGATEYPYIVGEGEPPAPFGVSFNLNGYYGKIQTAVENFNPTTFTFVAMPSGETTKEGTVGVDFMIQGSHFVIFAEGYFRNTDPVSTDFGDYDSFGVWGQAGYMLIDNALDVAVRVSWLDPSTDLDDDLFWAIEGQFAYYISAPNLVLKLRYGYGDQQTPGEEELGPVTLPIPPGHNHLATLQLNVAF